MTNKNVLGFGKDTESIAKPIGITGEENDEIRVLSIESRDLYEKILNELKKFNINLETITNTKLTQADVMSYKQTL